MSFEAILRDCANHDSDIAEQAAVEVRLSIEFVKACAKCDANALAPWADTVTDWAKCKSPLPAESLRPQRVQLLHEVLADTLTYEKPGISEVMQLVLNVAYGNDLVNAPAQARDLLTRMASTFAKHNAAH